MKKVRPILFLLIALLAGWAIGSYSTDHFYVKWIKHYQIHDALAGINDRLIPLTVLQSGDTNRTAELLESQMNDQIKLLGPMLPDLHVQPWDVRLFTELQNYRAGHPQKTNDPEIDSIISGVLLSTNASNLP
jgi:hypothetical protein